MILKSGPDPSISLSSARSKRWASAPSTIVRNLTIWNARPSRPRRSCRYRIGPGDVARTIAAAWGGTHKGRPFAVPILAGDRVAGAVVVFHDMTERRRAEAERAALLAREQAARAEAERAFDYRRHTQALARMYDKAL